ncbi:CaiB/BaiF CoA transferase family protein [Candidimonas nitroreducens]|uniref:CoA transferase n=1 Tax=Candidimonas nitroreducens TaxID=683354 RepID=A0A225LW16_9BURK|nr:CaiB/BaiF CoA-transferase family protein [Candidimonas nitroreducens]OWT53478.1 CoA transferase [Candidimonas nitroreducens]
MGALSHLRVLDLSRVLAGPWAGQVLADLGAEVIKVEQARSGDDTRAWGPPWAHDAQWGDEPQSAYFLAANRNKKSVAIDIRHESGRDCVRKLAMQCDVVIENFKVGGLKKYGLDYDSIRAVKPDIVYCSITGFGQTGPYAHRPGYDFLIQGLGGLMSLNGRPDGEPGAGPVKVGVALTDILTGLYATVGILAALAHRDKTGCGQHIDAALLDVQVACLANQAMNYLVSGKAPQRMGNAHPNIVPYQDFQTKDGYIIVAVGNDGQFRRFCEALGHPEWADDPRFSTNAERIAHRQTLQGLIQGVMRRRGTRAWTIALEEGGIPCGPINSLSDVFDDPHVRHREMQFKLPGGGPEAVSLVANPLRLSETPVEYRQAPPRLGAHTHAVLRERLGLSCAEIEALSNARAIRV